MFSASRSLRNSALAVLLASATGWAAADDGRQSIVVKALRDPVDKSYRKMVKGMELFEQMHAMAPGATLRYKLLPRKRDTELDDIGLHIVADRFDVPVTVSADYTFTLARYQRALDADAAVRSERRASSMTWRADIRTPGLPPDTRRLGDLRLECLVGVQAGLISRYPSFIGRLIELMRTPHDFCNGREVRYLFFAERPLFSVTLHAGDRRQSVPLGQLYAGTGRGRMPKADLPYCDCEALLDRAYVLPLGEQSWPDDTLVELEYMDAPAPGVVAVDEANDAILAGATKAEIAATLGNATEIRFDSGFEVWAYDYGAPAASAEFVLLFDPRGIVAKTRLRPAPPP